MSPYLSGKFELSAERYCLVWVAEIIVSPILREIRFLNTIHEVN